MFIIPFGNVAGPFLVLMAAGKRSAFVADHALQAVLYQALVSAFAWSLFLLALLHGWNPDAHFAVLLFSLLPVIWASSRAWQGKAFHYPLLARWVWGRERTRGDGR